VEGIQGLVSKTIFQQARLDKFMVYAPKHYKRYGNQLRREALLALTRDKYATSWRILPRSQILLAHTSSQRYAQTGRAGKAFDF